MVELVLSAVLNYQYANTLSAYKNYRKACQETEQLLAMAPNLHKLVKLHSEKLEAELRHNYALRSAVTKLLPELPAHEFHQALDTITALKHETDCMLSGDNVLRFLLSNQ